MNFMVILILEWVFFSLSSEAPGPDGAVNVGYGQTPETVVPESTPVNMVLKELTVPEGLTEEIKTSQKAIAPDASHDSQVKGFMAQHLWLRMVQAGSSWRAFASPHTARQLADSYTNTSQVRPESQNQSP